VLQRSPIATFADVKGLPTWPEERIDIEGRIGCLNDLSNDLNVSNRLEELRVHYIHPDQDKININARRNATKPIKPLPPIASNATNIW
jgi:hypothetical protein